MIKNILLYGVISGLIVSTMMVTTMPMALEDQNFALGEVLGYATMIIALSAVFFGIRSLRENHYKGVITFWQALGAGVAMSFVAALMYATTWEIYYTNFIPDFMEIYTKSCMDRMAAEGASEAEMALKSKEMADMAEWYKNPFLRFGMTIMEFFPVGVLASLVCAGILRRKAPAN